MGSTKSKSKEKKGKKKNRARYNDRMSRFPEGDGQPKRMVYIQAVQERHSFVQSPRFFFFPLEINIYFFSFFFVGGWVAVVLVVVS